MPKVFLCGTLSARFKAPEQDDYAARIQKAFDEDLASLVINYHDESDGLTCHDTLRLVPSDQAKMALSLKDGMFHLQIEGSLAGNIGASTWRLAKAGGPFVFSGLEGDYIEARTISIKNDATFVQKVPKALPDPAGLTRGPFEAGDIEPAEWLVSLQEEDAPSSVGISYVHRPNAGRFELYGCLMGPVWGGESETVYFRFATAQDFDILAPDELGHQDDGAQSLFAAARAGLDRFFSTQGVHTEEGDAIAEAGEVVTSDDFLGEELEELSLVWPLHYSFSPGTRE